MKVKDLEEGAIYVMKHSTSCVKAIASSRRQGGIHGFPAIHTLKKVKLIEVLPKGRALVEESFSTWDYENRPDGWTRADYMIHSTSKKPITRTKKYEVPTRSIIRAA